MCPSSIELHAHLAIALPNRPDGMPGSIASNVEVELFGHAEEASQRTST
jgi:hypothetical protein